MKLILKIILGLTIFVFALTVFGEKFVGGFASGLILGALGVFAYKEI